VPIAVILLGAICIDLAFRGTEHEFAAQMGQDFGGGKFLSWLAAMVFLGAIGYVPALRKLSNVSMALVIVVLVLSNGGLLTQLAKVITAPPSAAPHVAIAAAGAASGAAGGGPLGSLTGSGGPLGDLGSLFGDSGGGGSVIDLATSFF
jgi:hypothetical protein